MSFRDEMYSVGTVISRILPNKQILRLSLWHPVYPGRNSNRFKFLYVQLCVTLLTLFTKNMFKHMQILKY